MQQFDDGLTKNPTTHLGQVMGRLIGLLGNMFPSVNIFSSMVTSQVTTSSFKRMGMPQQTLDGKTAGGGSCGMGVI